MLRRRVVALYFGRERSHDDPERSSCRLVSRRTLEPVDRVRGMLDHLPDSAVRLGEIESSLRSHFERSGFRPIQAPILEFSELFLRKSGADVVSKMYTFTDHGGRRVCLRPEVTAPVVRAFVNHAHEVPLPARLWYVGPAFRYEKPQRGRYRQFTQVGVELLGAPPGFADAEIIALACAGLDHLGISDYRVVLGHIGVVLGMLGSLDLDTRMQGAVLQSLEALKKSPESMASTRRWLETLFGVDGAGDGVAVEPEADVRALLARLGREEAGALIRTLLSTLKTEIGGGRDPDEIVDRLLDRLSRTGEAERLDRAVQFVTELARLAGPRERAVPATEALLRRYGVPLQAIEEFRRVCDALDAFGMDWSRVTVDLSLGRGLQYYTGTVFEVYCSSLGAESQLCGGGRYDGLVRDLGGREDVPALGFSYGLERLALVRPRREGRGASVALVVPLSDGARSAAVRTAEELRAGGARAELDVRGRGRRAALEYADRAGIACVVLLDEALAASGETRVRWLQTREEAVVPSDQLARVVAAGSGEGVAHGT